MVTAVRRPFPAWRLAAGSPLPGHPPAPDLLRARRVLQIEDTHDIAEIAFERRRAVEITSVEIVAMHPGAGGFPARDLARLGRVADVVHAEAAAPTARRLAGSFVIDHHDAVRHPHL